LEHSAGDAAQILELESEPAPEPAMGPAPELPLAPKREPKPPLDIAAVHAERMKFWLPRIGDEARHRAYDDTVKTCETHYGIDREAAKQMVCAALHL
jgi:hypothetical protein